MLKFLADENFNNHITRGLRRHHQRVDLVRVQESGLEGADDPTVLEWAAKHGRILLTHDVRTIRPFAQDRIRQGLSMPGIVFIPQPFPRAEIIDDIAVLAECCEPHELNNQWIYLPLRRAPAALGQY